jgi:putative hydrolase of the HAD superfamily
MRLVNTILFDLDDTLHDDSRAYRAAARMAADDVARSHGIVADVLARAYDREVARFWGNLTAEHLSVGIADSRTQMWYDALRAAGIEDDVRHPVAFDVRELAKMTAAAYSRYRAEVLELAPGALALVETLRARGCKIGIVTNGFAATHHEKIARLGLTERVDAVFLADEMGMVKPDPGVFRHAMARLGSTSEHTAMVGDRYDRDISGALQLGLFTVLIDVHAAPIPPGAPRPDAIVNAVADVLDVLPLAAA